ncbi:hypothetical protein [Fervidibacillus halotolerans]|uniref:LysM domain-containing protein n=1 Tax=Fervidibacillus halotolerans TaxID=2980027 RepID=A0A9E8LXG6_9BACI|nr:hypothetical protein [Fervidibacillus halotolerans]WAA11472.1 hypothetical protein OE105_07455 [Fervidibacillus halotolerans]
MKRLAGVFFFLLCIVALYADLKFGTLPSNIAKEQIGVEAETIPFKEMMVRRGDTVLSIMERQGGFPNVPLDQIVHDFTRLNDGLTPEEIKPGNFYKFPIYDLPDSD